MSLNLLLSMALYITGHTLVWFNMNSQFVWEYWRDRPMLSVFIYAIPTSLCFWYATRIAYYEMDNLWGPRFLAFSMSWLTFPLFTWYFLNESMFTPKTLTCIALSILIISIQLFWK